MARKSQSPKAPTKAPTRVRKGASTPKKPIGTSASSKPTKPMMDSQPTIDASGERPTLGTGPYPKAIGDGGRGPLRRPDKTIQQNAPRHDTANDVSKMQPTHDTTTPMPDMHPAALDTTPLDKGYIELDDADMEDNLTPPDDQLQERQPYRPVDPVHDDTSHVHPPDQSSQPAPTTPKVYCADCIHFRYTKNSAQLGFPPLCNASPDPDQFIASSGPLSLLPCNVVNIDGHCNIYSPQPTPTGMGATTTNILPNSRTQWVF